MLLILQAIGERLARDGEGLLAWKVICNAGTSLTLTGAERHRPSLRWIKGIAYRALGEFSRAARELRAVRQQLISDGLNYTILP